MAELKFGDVLRYHARHKMPVERLIYLFSPGDGVFYGMLLRDRDGTAHPGSAMGWMRHSFVKDRAWPNG